MRIIRRLDAPVRWSATLARRDHGQQRAARPRAQFPPCARARRRPPPCPGRQSPAPWRRRRSGSVAQNSGVGAPSAWAKAPITAMSFCHVPIRIVGGVVAALGHHRRAQLEDARRRGAGTDQLDDLPRREPGLDREHHRLGGGDVVDGDEEVRHELHARAVAEGAEVVRFAGEAGKERPVRFDGGGAAARIDDEIPGPGLRPGAAQRAVERDVPGLAQDGLEGELVLRASVLVSMMTRRFPPAAAISRATASAACGLGKLVIRLGARLAAAATDSAISTPSASSSARSRRVDVEADRAPADCDEVTGDRAAHDAQSDDADRVRHSDPRLPRGPAPALAAPGGRDTERPIIAIARDGHRCASASLVSAAWARPSRSA